MRRNFQAVILCLLGFAPLAVLAQASSRQAEEFMALVKRPLLYAIQPDRAEVQAGLPAGKRKDGTALTIDIYLPRKSTAPLRPVALLLHGGLPDEAPVRPGEWRMFKDWGAALAQAGVAAVMFNHSLGFPQRRIDEAMAEIDQVMGWLRSAPAQYQIDAKRITAITFSAGGLLVPELVRRYDSAGIQRYALFYPLLGIKADEFNTPAVAAKLRFTEAVPLLAERGTPLLIFRSGADEIPGLLPLLDESIAAALKADARIELTNLPKAPHAFDSLQDEAQTRRAIERAIRFAAADG